MYNGSPPSYSNALQQKMVNNKTEKLVNMILQIFRCIFISVKSVHNQLLDMNMNWSELTNQGQTRAFEELLT